ncbi:uroplakin-3a [Ambystoma mexicanum]|uniref:uroplakin-3a n=1 Tax=Ambystoma mexicanum TaxID=8296 RepID=UPI0037E9642B
MASACRLLSWALLAAAVVSGQAQGPPVTFAVTPQVAGPALVPNTPTLNTVALQKPVCLFDSQTGGDPANYQVELFAMAASAPSSTPLASGNTFRNTSGGTTGPYVAGKFGVPNCTLVGSLTPSQDDFLRQYIFRVGDNPTCLTDPNFSGICNPPLANSTAYRFLYSLVHNNGSRVANTHWSDRISTKNVKTPDTLDTWPGKRSGGMIVITSILSTLLFFLLSGFVAAAAANVLSGGPSKGVTTRHETRTTEQAMPKAQDIAEPSYSTVPPAERERYAAKPQA